MSRIQRPLTHNYHSFLPLPLPSKDKSVLLVIDVQESLVKAMNKETIESVINKISLLIKVAKRLGIPIIWTEQYPKGLKETVEPLKTLLIETNAKYIEKTEFSCMLSSSFKELITTLPLNTFVITGIETHVCILQTAIDMKIVHPDWNVYVTGDATCSRREIDFKMAERFMRLNGIGFLSAESIIFSWLERAGTQEFKDILSIIKQNGI